MDPFNKLPSLGLSFHHLGQFSYRLEALPPHRRARCIKLTICRHCWIGAMGSDNKESMQRHLCQLQPFFFHFSLQEIFGGFLHSSPSVLPILDASEFDMKKLPKLCLRQPQCFSSSANF